MRIVGGAARGRRLAVPGSGTRPTSDRAREAMFNALDSRLDLAGAAVLDLYAGSGAVGLEALSRGATRVVLVESDRAAAEVVRRNVAVVALPGAEIVVRPVAAVVGQPSDEPFDLVFADPPYALGEDELAAVLASVAAHGWLAADGELVVERSSRSPEPTWPDGLSPTSQRQYGEAALWYGRPR